MKLTTICYLDNGSQFLLLKRDKKPNDIHEGKWVSVGGKFEPGETPEECAIREIKEETGLTATQLDLQGFITFPDFTQDGEDWYSFIYRVPEFEGELIADEDSREGTLEWVDYDEVMNKPTWDGDYVYLRWIFEEKPFFSAKFAYNDQEELIEQSVEFFD